MPRKPVAPIDWDQIDHVFFDMDGTLLDLHYDNHFWQQHLPQRYADIHSLPLPEAAASLVKHIQSLQGQLNWYCIDYWSDTLKVDIIALKQETAHKIQWRPYAKFLLQHLNQLNKPLYLVTNAHPKAIALKHQHVPLTHYFKQVISSHDLKAAKETENFWTELGCQLDFQPEKTLFIDDNHQVLVSADQHGKIGHLFGIEQPDSQVAKVTDSSYPLIDCFSRWLS